MDRLENFYPGTLSAWVNCPRQALIQIDEIHTYTYIHINSEKCIDNTYND